jgi:hypothetical protein
MVAFMAAVPARASAQPTPPAPLDVRLQQLVSAVSEARLSEVVHTLAGFGTRNTLSGTASPTRGIGAARQWIFDELRHTSPRLHVSFDTHRVAKDARITRNVEVRNILAVLPGKSARRIYLTAHYDTVNIGEAGQIGANTRAAGQRTTDPQLRADQNYDVDAPGANDNGSGTALTMELARVLATSGLEFDATIVFALWAGEEQGLIGSRAHVQHLAATTLVDATINNDIVGNSHGGNGNVDGQSVRLYSDGPEDSGSRSLARFLERAAALYVPAHRVRLMARADRFSRGSDHTSFSDRGYAAVTFRESTENFAKQHSALDTVEGVDFAYLAQNARVNVAGVAALALAPPAPVVTNERGQAVIGRQPSGYDARLRWLPSPGATAYRIYWRETWSNDWKESRLIGDETEFTLPGVSIDDYVFGVAAIGPDGYESLVTAYVERRQKRGPVKLR